MTDEEINRRIHEEIMGGGCWHDEDDTAPSEYNFGGTITACSKCGSQLTTNRDYCNDISDAFKVVGKMEADSWSWRGHYFAEVEGDRHGFAFWKGESDYHARAGAVSKAIALAALKTLESKS